MGAMIAIFLGFLGAATAGWPAAAQITWEVPGNFPTVQAALASTDTSSGDIIKVSSWENEPFPVVLTKSVTIECVNGATLEVPLGHAGIVIPHNPAQQQAVVRNCTITSQNRFNPDQHGAIAIVVKERGANEPVLLENNTIYGMWSGIRLINSTNVTVRNNRLWDIGPVVNNQRTGIAIMLEGSNGNVLENNQVLKGSTVPEPFQSIPDIYRNHCGEGLFLFHSDNNTITGDVYAGCTTNGITLNNSNGNVLTSVTVTDNGSWGVDFSLSDDNELNASLIARNAAGGIKLEGAQNNRISNPDQRGNLVVNNGDGIGEDIQILLAEGEKAVFTAPQFFQDGNKPNDLLNNAPNDLRAELNEVAQKIEHLHEKFVVLDRALDVLTGLLDAEVGILHNIQTDLQRGVQTSSVKVRHGSRLTEKQTLIAVTKVLIFGCLVGQQAQIGGKFDVNDLPQWERDLALDGQTLAQFCQARMTADAVIIDPNTPSSDDDFDITGDLTNPFFENGVLSTIEDEKAEIKDDIERQGSGSLNDPKGLKQKIEDLVDLGLIPQAERDNLLQKLDGMVGLLLDVNSELEDILWKLVVSDWLLASPQEKDACFDDPNTAVTCFQALLTKRTPPGSLPFPTVPNDGNPDNGTDVTAAKSVIDAKLWVEEARKEKVQITDDVLDSGTCTTNQFFTVVRGDKFDCLLSLLEEIEAEIPETPFAINCFDLISNGNNLGCLLGKLEQGGLPLDTSTLSGVTTDLVNRLNSDAQAIDFRFLTTSGDGTWVIGDIAAQSTGPRGSIGNVIANNVLYSEQQGTQIGILIESANNDFIHNWITNEDVFPASVDGDGTDQGKQGRISQGMVVLADDNEFFLNTCEEIDTCVILGSSSPGSRDDLQHKHLFHSLAITACAALSDPMDCGTPAEKILLYEVMDDPLSVSQSSVLVTGFRFVLNFFEGRQAMNIVSAQDGTIEENLFLGGSVFVGVGVNCQTMSWEHNDFRDLTLQNNGGSACNWYGSVPPYNWQPAPLGSTVTVIGPGSAPEARDPIDSNCTNENFGSLTKFQTWGLERYFGTTTIPNQGETGNLPPNLNYTPAGVDVPPGKPRTCDAAGANEPVPLPRDDIPGGNPTFQAAVASMTQSARTAAESCPAIRDGVLGLLRGGGQPALVRAQEAAATCRAAIEEVLANARQAQQLLVGGAALSRQQRIGEVLLGQLLTQADRIARDLQTCEVNLGTITDPGDRRQAMGALRSCLRPAALTRVLQVLANRIQSAVDSANLQIQALAVEWMTLAQHGSVYTLRVEGQGITEARLEVYDVSGRAVFRHQAVADRAGRSLSLMFAGLSEEGQRLANGVYLAVVTVTGLDGQQVRRIQKLIVLR